MCIIIFLCAKTDKHRATNNQDFMVCKDWQNYRNQSWKFKKFRNNILKEVWIMSLSLNPLHLPFG